MPKKASGLFIVLEGPEGCGKSTQVDLLVQWLKQQGRPVIQTKEPGGTPEGQKIRQKLLNPNNQLTDLEELELFEKDRQHHIPVIKSWLEQGKMVVCDRFNPSTFAYQVAGRKVITSEEFDERDRAIVGELIPDLSILLDVYPQEGFARKGKETKLDRIEQAGIEFHQKVRQGFLDFVDRRPEDNWVVIDADQSVDEIAKQIQQAVKPLLPRLNQ